MRASAVIALLVFVALSAPLRAERVGVFDVRNCSADDLCDVAVPGTGFVYASATREELAVSNAYFEEMERADAILERRGFSDLARVGLLHGWSHAYGRDIEPEIKQIAEIVYMPLVHGNRYKHIVQAEAESETFWLLTALAWTQGEKYDVVSGRKLDMDSLVSFARSVPACYDKGDPFADCRPLRYEPTTGCLMQLSADDPMLTDPYSWYPCECADLAMLPSAGLLESMIDLSTAQRISQKVDVAEVSEHRNKMPAGPVSARDNPAGREVCTW